MTHQPPVPAGSQSPYPLQPAPIPEEVKQRAAERDAHTAEAQSASGPSQGTLFGIAGAVALGAAAALTGYFYSRGKQATGRKGKAGAKRTSGKAKVSRKTATGQTRH